MWHGDGVWDAMNTAECCDAVRAMVAAGDVGNVCETLLDMCLGRAAKITLAPSRRLAGPAVPAAAQGRARRRRP